MKSYHHFLILHIQRVKILIWLYLVHLKLFSIHGYVGNPSCLEYIVTVNEKMVNHRQFIPPSRKPSCIDLFGKCVSVVFVRPIYRRNIDLTAVTDWYLRRRGGWYVVRDCGSLNGSTLLAMRCECCGCFLSQINYFYWS